MTKKGTKKEAQTKQVLADGRIAIYFKIEPELWDKLDRQYKREHLASVTQLCKITCQKLADSVK